MKLTILLKSITKKFSSITMVLLAHGEQLRKRGHTVNVVVLGDRGYTLRKDECSGSTAFSYNARKFYCLLRGGGIRLKAPWYDCRPQMPIIEVPDASECYIPDADVIIAGYVWMLDALVEYKNRKGKKFYLVQGFELQKPRNRERYRYSIRKIVVSTSLKEQIYETMSQEEIGPIAVVTNGVDLDIFSSEGRCYQNRRPVRVGMVYYYKAPNELKGFMDGVRAFEMAKKHFPNLELVLFGTCRGKDVPDYAEFHTSPSRAKIAEIYRSCDIFLYPSREDAFGLPPLEAMACGCAVVTTEVGGVKDYAVRKETALISVPGKPEELARNLEYLLKHPEKRQEMAKKAATAARNYSWEKVSERMERILFSEQSN